jgi:hypothetical protein
VRKVEPGRIEGEPEFTDLHFCPVAQQRRIDPDPVEVGAVERPEVFDLECRPVPQELCVPSRHRHIVEKNVCFWMPADCRHVGIQQKSCTNVRPPSNYQ